MPRDAWGKDRDKDKGRRILGKDHKKEFEESRKLSAIRGRYAQQHPEIVQEFLACVQNNGAFQDRLDGKKNWVVPQGVFYSIVKFYKEIGLRPLKFTKSSIVFDADSVIEACESQGVSLLPSLADYQAEQKSKPPQGQGR